ncbi:conserved hypothetical protein [Vibrio chagasii]|uniref:hypothetical protein n=1 Tax=Vibrio chagasii TaxID=170679 RepID=UPI0033807231|nr:conserved hypothetical protein [Vibrio chagasii]
MAVFNSESIKKYLQETFSEELDLAFENAKDKGYQQAAKEAHTSIQEELRDTKAELKELEQSICHAKKELIELKREASAVKDSNSILSHFEKSIDIFNNKLVEEEKFLYPCIISHLTRVFDGVLSPEIFNDYFYHYALEQAEANAQKSITMEVSPRAYEEINQSQQEIVKLKINSSLVDGEVIVRLKSQDIHLSLQGIKTQIKSNVQELIDAL